MKINVIIDRIENDIAILKTEDNFTINWPLKLLPDQIKESSALSIIISTNTQIENEKKEIAKEVLNELLTIEEEK